ncbi:glycosyltransferase [Olivibacter domesticus]|uniref:glycosyltransferase n=1 Tax=Olivibacter domesticus TaxID=407022 RepID=UPI003605CFE1
MQKKKNSKKKSGVSVIICCYNSVSRLQLTLGHLAKQKVPDGFLWEIILVNNASTDETVKYARETWEKLQPASKVLKIIDEDTPGQMYARKKGAREAQYDCLIFCDDDNLLDENYVALSAEILTDNKSVGAVGGQNHPVTNASEYPTWFETFKDKYAIGIPAKHSGDITHRGFILGAGLITRKKLFLDIFHEKYPSLLNGRKGENLSTGDDFEYCKRLLLWGYRLYYDQRLLLDHYIPQERLTLDYRERLMKGIDDAGKILNEYDLTLKIINKIKKKNKLRLMFITPFRILFAKLKFSKRNLEEEELVLFYLNPFKTADGSVRSCIRNFMNRHSFH